MDVTCFSTARSVTTSRSAIATFEQPLGHQLEHLPLAWCELVDRIVRRRRPTSCETTEGSSAEPPSPTRLTAATNSGMSATRSFSR